MRLIYISRALQYIIYIVKIYTKTGDSGSTSLFAGKRVDKNLLKRGVHISFAYNNVQQLRFMFKSLIRNHWILLAILTISLFFRFYNFQELQFWNADDEVITAVIRHIIWDKSPTLLVPNSFLGFGLGPFFHFILTPLYFITNFNLVLIQAFASLLGVLTTYIVYKGGQLLGGKKTGLIAAFLYASSFLISFFDRRIWPLTPDAFLATITFWLLVQVVRGKNKYLPLLAIPIGFSFHSDPSLITLDIAIFFTWIIYRLPIKNKFFLAAIMILTLFASPILGAEIKYKGAVTKPVIQALTKPISGGQIAPNFERSSPVEYINVFSRYLATAPSKKIDQNYCHGCPQGYADPLLTPIIQVIILVIIFGSFIILLTKKNKFARETQILWLMIFSFILGLTIYNEVFKGNISQNYFSVIAPIFILMVAQVLSFIHKYFKAIFFLILSIYLLINLNTLVRSTVDYPLYRKIDLVQKSINSIEGKTYSIQASTGDLITGGWTELFITKRSIPINSYWYDYLDWIYQAYSLYPGPVKTESPERIVWFTKTNFQPKLELPIISTFVYKDMQVYIFDNSTQIKKENIFVK